MSDLDPTQPAPPSDTEPVAFDQKGRGQIAPVKLVATPSADGGVLSILFEGLTADTQRTADEGAVAARVVSLNWPLVHSGTERAFFVDVRWLAVRPCTTRASISVTIFGVTHSFEVPPLAFDQPSQSEPWRLTGTVPAVANVFTASVLVCAERLSLHAGEHALLTVDSLDIMWTA